MRTLVVTALFAATATAPALAQGRAHDADIAFMRGMIAHHRQALEMTALIPDRTDNGTIRMVAKRIELSQQAEIERMRRWLEARGQAAADAGEDAGADTGTAHGGAAHGHGAHADHAAMPGMLTPEEMDRLAAAAGAAFDRLFLELMIRHHQGAVTMVEELNRTPGAGVEPELFQLMSHIDADQRAEIARLSKLLTAITEED